MTGRLVVATDGACSGNPGPSGWAWVTDGGRWGAGGLACGTNNEAELLAVTAAVAAHPDARDVLVLSDSQYAIGVATRWGARWAVSGWVTRQGRPVANRDTVERLLALTAGRRVAFRWVRGHDGHVLNEWADRMAAAAAFRARGGRTAPAGTMHGAAPLDVTVQPPAREAHEGGHGRTRHRRPSRWVNQTRLGEALGGLTAIEAGRMLDAAGLRGPSDRSPSHLAVHAGLARARRHGRYTQWLWREERTVAFLASAGVGPR